MNTKKIKMLKVKKVLMEALLLPAKGIYKISLKAQELLYKELAKTNNDLEQERRRGRWFA